LSLLLILTLSHRLSLILISTLSHGLPLPNVSFQQRFYHYTLDESNPLTNLPQQKNLMSLSEQTWSTSTLSLSTFTMWCPNINPLGYTHIHHNLVHQIYSNKNIDNPIINFSKPKL
jgi:hypothetical protein